MKIENLILIGAIGLGAYLLLKSGILGSGFASGGGGSGFAGGGGGNELGGESGGNTLGGITPPITPARAIHNAAGSRQSWTGVTYGELGQPSVKFLTNTLNEAQQSKPPLATKQAAAAAYAGAPPRVVAKIKAGQNILNGGKY